MTEGMPAFTAPSCLHVSHFRSTHVSSVCRIPRLFLARGTNARNCREHHNTVFATVDRSSAPVEPILEGDLIAYRDDSNAVWNLGAVTNSSNVGKYHVRSLYSRNPAEEGTIECFVDWEENSPELTIAHDTHEITFVEADYEERVVQDRLENPHGEVSEDCWRISTQMLDSLGVFIREYHKS